MWFLWGMTFRLERSFCMRQTTLDLIRVDAKSNDRAIMMLLFVVCCRPDRVLLFVVLHKRILCTLTVAVASLFSWTADSGRCGCTTVGQQSTVQYFHCKLLAYNPVSEVGWTAATCWGAKKICFRELLGRHENHEEIVQNENFTSVILPTSCQKILRRNSCYHDTIPLFSHSQD